MMMLLEHNEIKDLNQLEFMSGLSQAIEKGGWTYVSRGCSMDDLDTYRRFLNRGFVDGMILNSPRNTDPRITPAPGAPDALCHAWPGRW
ncbi:MAG: hypothetical protein R3E95_11565 [Thiolinea sp.]